MQIKSFLGAIAAIFAAVSTTSAVAASEMSRSMITGKATSQPIGHYEFCQKNREECGSNRNLAPAIMSESKWDAVRAVNVAVNRAITPMTDKEIYGKDEVWIYPTTEGDCEDYALLKRRMLMEKGFTAADLLMTVVRKPDGEGHAILTVRTTDGDFVLDNLNSDVKAWTDTGYTFIKRQSSTNAGRWVTIEKGSDGMLVGALQ